MWITTLVHLVRSRSLVYAFAISALGAFLISSGGKVPDFSIPIRLVASTYLVALATYLYNDITDYQIDKINNRRSAHELDSIKHRITICYTIAFFVIATVLAFSINIATGSASLIFSGLAIAYSNPRIQLKNMFVIKTAVTGSGAFITSMMGCLASGTFSYLGIIASLIPFLFYFILGPLGDISDLKGDSKAGRRTFPIVLGIKRTLIITVSAIFIIASLFFISNMYLGISIAGTVVGIVVTMFMLSKIYKASKHYDDKLELSKCRRSIRYCIFACQISLLTGVLTTGIFF
ncbi:MAG: UbiA family prenyltransferase [Nitrosotalea sp.]